MLSYWKRLASGWTMACVSVAALAAPCPDNTPGSDAKPCPADAPNKVVAVVSLIGKSLDLVYYRGQTGTNLSQDRKSVPFADPLFDNTVLVSAREALLGLDAKAAPVLLRGSDKLYEQGRALIDAKPFVVPAELESVLKTQHATHLLLVTRYRDTASLSMAYSTASSGGWLEGLGYYMDYIANIQRVETNETGKGYFAPYAYFRVSLVDLATLSVVKEKMVTTSRTLGAGLAGNDPDPWNVLTPEKKVTMLNQMVHDGVRTAVAEVAR